MDDIQKVDFDGQDNLNLTLHCKSHDHASIHLLEGGQLVESIYAHSDTRIDRPIAIVQIHERIRTWLVLPNHIQRFKKVAAGYPVQIISAKEGVEFTLDSTGHDFDVKCKIVSIHSMGADGLNVQMSLVIQRKQPELS